MRVFFVVVTLWRRGLSQNEWVWVISYFCPEEFHRALPGCAKKNSSQATLLLKIIMKRKSC